MKSIHKLLTKITVPFLFDYAANGKSLMRAADKKRAAKRSIEFTEGMQKISITSFDGLRLQGYYRTVQNADRVIIAAHGWHASPKYDFKYQRDIFEKLHCNVLYIDERSHGKSEGKYIGFGVLERYDILRWAEFAKTKLCGALPLYVIGVSMGATSTMMALELGLSKWADGVIADCGFSSPIDIWLHNVKNQKWIDRDLFSVLCFKRCQKLAGYKGDEARTPKAVKNCDIPILFIHGLLDDFVPPFMTMEAFESCKYEYKRLFTVEGAKHARSCKVDPKGYEKQLDELFSFCERKVTV